MKEKNNVNTREKYSEILMQLVGQFDEQLPETLTFEETLEVGMDAWNLANNKKLLGDDSYKKELTAYKYGDIIDKMVLYKLEHFTEYNNIIVDFNTENDIVQVKNQTPEEHFNNLLSRMVNAKPTKK